MRISDWSSDVCSSDLKLSYTFQGDVGSSREFAFATGGSPFTLKGVDPKGFGSIDGGISALFKERIGVFVQGGLNFGGSQRSEEHTSELQSLMRISYAVFCLKKKNTQQKNNRLNT